MASDTQSKPVKKWKPRYVPQSDSVPSMFAACASSKPLKFKSTTTRKWTPKKPSTSVEDTGTPPGVPASFAAANHPKRFNSAPPVKRSNIVGNRRVESEKLTNEAPISSFSSSTTTNNKNSPVKKWGTTRPRPVPPPVNRVQPPPPVEEEPEPPKEDPTPEPPPTPEPTPAPVPAPPPVVQAPPSPAPAPIKPQTPSPEFVSPKKPSKFAVIVPEIISPPKYVPKHAPESPPKPRPRASVRIENIAALPITTDAEKAIDLLKAVEHEGHSIDSHQDSIDNPPSQTSSQAKMEEKMRKLLKEQGLEYAEDSSVSISSASSSDDDSDYEW